MLSLSCLSDYTESVLLHIRCGRLVLDLGLHLDCLHLLDRGILTDTDRYVRSVTFWGIWSVDKEYSAMVGRPCSIRNVVITCPKSGHWTLEDFVSLVFAQFTYLRCYTMYNADGNQICE